MLVNFVSPERRALPRDSSLYSCRLAGSRVTTIFMPSDAVFLTTGRVDANVFTIRILRNSNQLRYTHRCVNPWERGSEDPGLGAKVMTPIYTALDGPSKSCYPKSGWLESEYNESESAEDRWVGKAPWPEYQY